MFQDPGGAGLPSVFMGVGRSGAATLAFAVMVVTASGTAWSGAALRPGAMSLREKVGQLVMFAPRGPALSQSERDVMRAQDIGGVILFAQNYDNRTQLAALTEQIQRVVRSGTSHRIGALISVDQEGGIVKRFPDMPPWRSAPEIGDTGSISVAFDEGRATGRALRRAGVNINLAPVADLDLPPEHVMRSRSFGSVPRAVGRLTDWFARGLQRAGTAATAKHFPGLGGAPVNSDDGRAYVYRSRRQLRRTDAVPFHKAVDGGIRLVMLSHGIYVNHGGRRPASVHYFIATKRLRREFDFTGVAISDALEPVAWKFGGSTPRACKATIRAGVDIALITGDVFMARRCAREIRRGVISGDIPRARVNRAVERVLRLKRWLGLVPG